MQKAKNEIDISGLVLQKTTTYGVEMVKNPASDIYTNAVKMFTKLLLENTSAKEKDIDEDGNKKIDKQEKQKLDKMYKNLKKMASIL